MTEITVEEVMKKYNISIKDSELRLLQNISKNKVSRSDDPGFWL